jgi:hypothetical protein
MVDRLIQSAWVKFETSVTDRRHPAHEALSRRADPGSGKKPPRRHALRLPQFLPVF